MEHFEVQMQFTNDTYVIFATLDKDHNSIKANINKTILRYWTFIFLSDKNNFVKEYQPQSSLQHDSILVPVMYYCNHLC